jgi:hypothetical protein
MRQTGKIYNYEFSDVSQTQLAEFLHTPSLRIDVNFSSENLPATIHLCLNLDYHYSGKWHDISRTVEGSFTDLACALFNSTGVWSKFSGFITQFV